MFACKILQHGPAMPTWWSNPPPACVDVQAGMWWHAAVYYALSTSQGRYLPTMSRHARVPLHYMHTWMHAYIHTYMHTYIHTCMNASVRPSVHPSMHPPIHPSIHPSFRPSVRPSVRASVRPCVRTYLRTYLRAYTYTHVQEHEGIFKHIGVHSTHGSFPIGLISNWARF